MSDSAQPIPSFGDFEIRSLVFEHPSVRVILVDPFDDAALTVVFHGVGYVLFETNHPQNVIESMRIFATEAELRSDPVAGVFAARSDLAGVRNPHGFAYLQPIAGGEMMIAFERYEICERQPS